MKAKIKRVVISPDMLFSILEGNTAWRVTNGIPKGARLRGFTQDPYANTLNLFVEHETFEAIEVTTVCPQLEIFFKRIT